MAIASSAWTVYTDLRKRTARPAPAGGGPGSPGSSCATAATPRPDEVVEVVVTETVQAGADQEECGGLTESRAGGRAAFRGRVVGLEFRLSFRWLANWRLTLA